MEGLKACKNFASLFSVVKVKSQTTTSQQLNIVQDEGFNSSAPETHDAPTENSSTFDQLSCMVSVTILLIILYDFSDYFKHN